VEAARANPDAFAKKTLKQVADHTTEVITALDKKPAAIGPHRGPAGRDDRGPGLVGGHRRDRPRSLPRSSAAAVLGDHTVPWAIAEAAYDRQRRNPGVTEIVKVPNRGHSLTIDHGWREVAETALDFVKRYT
jgi:pimeloyl-ACP methyl ester carboxylesterase